MQLKVFGDLAVALYAGAIGGNDRIVAIAVCAHNRRKRGHWCAPLRAWNAQFVALDLGFALHSLHEALAAKINLLTVASPGFRAALAELPK